MAVDPKKRQKKLERRNAKRKGHRREVALRNPTDWASRLERASNAPLVHCCVNANVWEQGIGNVLVSRQLADGQIIFVIFLVDLYCLGVKDVTMGVTGRIRYDQELLGKLARDNGLEHLQPACARKLIEGAIAFASEANLPPHRDYRKAKAILGDVDPSECTREFEYGQDGKHYFFAGPHDTPARCREIMNTLMGRFGQDGFHFTIPLGPAAGPGRPGAPGMPTEEIEDDDRMLEGF